MGRGKPGGGIGVKWELIGAKVSYHCCTEGEWGDSLVSAVLLTKKGIRTAREFCRMPNGHCTPNEFYI